MNKLNSNNSRTGQEPFVEGLKMELIRQRERIAFIKSEHSREMREMSQRFENKFRELTEGGLTDAVQFSDNKPITRAEWNKLKF